MVNRNEVKIDVTVDERDATKGFKKTRIEADKTKNSVNKLGGSFKKLGGAIAGALAGASIAAAFAFSIKSASNLQESINAVAVVFGDAAIDITNFGRTAAREVGLANAEFNQLATTTGAMLKNVGFSQSRMAAETIRLTKRAADMASVFNTDVTQALSAINAALRGEIDPIERFGVSMNAATIEAKALELGLAKTKAEISAADKQVARLAVIMEQTAVVEGDFANTSDEFANSVRILKSDLTDLAASLGTKMIPAVEGGLKVVGPMVAQFKEWSEEGASVESMLLDIAVASEGLEPVAAQVNNIARAFGLLGKNLKEAALHPERALGFNEIIASLDAAAGLIPGGEDFAAKVIERRTRGLLDTVNELVQAREKLANFPDSRTFVDPFVSISGRTQDSKGILANTLRKAVAELEILDTEKELVATLSKELIIQNDKEIVGQLQFDLIMQQRDAERAVAEEAARTLQIKMETFQLQQRMHAFSVATSTRSADFIAASAGLGPEGGGGISGFRIQQGRLISGDLIAELVERIQSGNINDAKLIDEGDRTGVILDAKQGSTNVNVFLEESQVNSRLGQSVEDGA